MAIPEIFPRPKIRAGWVTILMGLTIFVTAPGCGMNARKAAQENGPENVVLIVVDTLRADRLEATRNEIPVMPRLKARSETGWNFTRAISPGSWTKPSMASMFTSLYPEVHNVQFLVSNTDPKAPVMTDVLAEDIETLGTYMKEHGYATAAVQANSLLQEVGAERGFDSYEFLPYPEYRANRITEAALEVIADLESPFFLYVHYMDPHAEYTPPEEYREIFGPLPEISRQDAEILKEWPDYYMDRIWHDQRMSSKRKFADLSESARERMRILYDGEARFIDDQVDRLLDAVDARHPNTFTILTADHGEELWEHGSVGHGKSVYEEVVHVPLFMTGPGLNRSRIEELVQTFDILPSIAHRLGLVPRSHWQGRSLFNSVKDSAKSRPAFVNNLGSYKSTGMEQWAVYSSHFKLVKYLNSDRQFLFDLAADPNETDDVSAADAPQVKLMTDQLTTHREQNQLHVLYSGAALESPMPPDLEERIGGIGYLK